MVRHLFIGPLFIALLVGGCSMQNPRWASSINPCCGQDELLEGEEPSEERCADMVVSREAAMQIAWGAAAGSGMTQWRVRLLPGGPACIWRKWPGLTDDDYLEVDPGAEAASDTLEKAPGDTTSQRPGGGSADPPGEEIP
jgi:hypothetical protein